MENSLTGKFFTLLKGAIQVLLNGGGGGGYVKCRLFQDYKGVRSSLISVTREWWGRKNVE